MTERTICPACSAPLTYSPGDQQVRCDFCGDEFRVVQAGDHTELRVVDKPQPQSDQLASAGQELAHEVEQEAVQDAIRDTEHDDAQDVSSGSVADDDQRTVIYRPQDAAPNEGQNVVPPLEMDITPGLPQDPTRGIGERSVADDDQATVIRGLRGADQDAGDVDDLAGAYPGTVREAEGEPVAPSFATAATTYVAPEVPEPETFPQSGSPIGAANLPPVYDAQAGQPAPYDSAGPAVQRPPTQAGRRNQWITLGVSFFVVFCLLCLCVAGAIVVYLIPAGGTIGF